VSRRHHGGARPHRSSGHPRPNGGNRPAPSTSAFPPSPGAFPLSPDGLPVTPPGAAFSRPPAARPAGPFDEGSRPLAQFGPATTVEEQARQSLTPAPEVLHESFAPAPSAHRELAAIGDGVVVNGHQSETLPRAGLAPPAGCTAPQLRRFIKSRPYVPMHELRRRFGINGGDDDVTAVLVAGGWIYLGLPAREGLLLGELLRGGEVGYELSLDPRTPVVVGLYPMRPVARS
jgi:hypothetical protein